MEECVCARVVRRRRRQRRLKRRKKEKLSVFYRMIIIATVQRTDVPDASEEHKNAQSYRGNVFATDTTKHDLCLFGWLLRSRWQHTDRDWWSFSLSLSNSFFCTLPINNESLNKRERESRCKEMNDDKRSMRRLVEKSKHIDRIRRTTREEKQNKANMQMNHYLFWGFALI